MTKPILQRFSDAIERKLDAPADARKDRYGVPAQFALNADPAGAGFDEARLQRITDAIVSDIRAETFDGCVLIAARGDKIAYAAAIGYAERRTSTPMAFDSILASMSIGKQFTNVMVLSFIERGLLNLNTQLHEVIPELAGAGKRAITIYDLLTHRSGLVNEEPPGITLANVGDLAANIRAIGMTGTISPIGERVQYSAYANHAVLGEMLRRVDPKRRPWRQIMKEELFRPLSMLHTACGKPKGLGDALSPIVARDTAGIPANMEVVSHYMNAEYEVPAGGFITCAEDVHRFASMLRNGGVLGEARLLSPSMLDLAAQNHTGDDGGLWHMAQAAEGWKPTPSNIGLGFFVRGSKVQIHPFGVLASARAFGGLGHGSTCFWVDPERDLSFVFLSTGLIRETRHVKRLQRYSDLIISALTAHRSPPVRPFVPLVFEGKKEAEMTVGVIGTLKVKPDANAEFEAAFRALQGAVRANEPGNKMYDLYRSPKDASTYIVMELYDDQASFKTHMKTDHFRELSGKLAPFLAGPPQIEQFDFIS